MTPRPRRTGARGAALGLAILALAGCGSGPGGDRPDVGPAAPPRASEPVVLGDATLDSPSLRVQLLEVKRVEPEVLEVTLAVTNRDRATAIGVGAAFAAAPADSDSLADVYLLDEAREKKYFVLRDRDGRAVGSEGVGPIEPGGRRTVWARFAGPPPGVSRITVQLPRVAPFRNVAIAEPKGRG